MTNDEWDQRLKALLERQPVLAEYYQHSTYARAAVHAGIMMRSPDTTILSLALAFVLDEVVALRAALKRQLEEGPAPVVIVRDLRTGESAQEKCDDCGCRLAPELGRLEEHKPGCRNFPF